MYKVKVFFLYFQEAILEQIMDANTPTHPASKASAPTIEKKKKAHVGVNSAEVIKLGCIPDTCRYVSSDTSVVQFKFNRTCTCMCGAKKTTGNTAFTPTRTTTFVQGST